MNVNPDNKVELDLYHNQLLPLDAWPVDHGDDKWAAPLVGYDESSKFKWDIDGWLDQVDRDGTTYYDVSSLTTGTLVRVATADTPAILGITEKTDDTLEVVPVDEDTAIELLTVTSNTGSTDDTASQQPDQLDVNTTDDTTDTTTANSSTTTSSTTTTSSSGSGSSSSSASRSSNIARKDRRLPANSDIGDISLRSVMDGQPTDTDGTPLDDFGDSPILGFQVVYTTGSTLLVPRDDLLDKMDELDIPEWMAPYQVAPHDAFSRACKSFLNGGEKRHDVVKGYVVTYTLEQHDNKYDRTLVATQRIPEDECGVDGGDVEHYKVARVKYDKDTRDISAALNDEAENTMFENEWENRLEPELRRLFEMHQTHHTGDDLNNKTLRYLVTNWTESVRIRDACYFIPAVYDGLQELLQSFSQLYEWLDSEHKHSGQETNFYYFAINNTEQERKMVRDRVLDELEDSIDDLFDDIYETMADDDFAEDVVEEILADHQSEMETVADRYSEIVEGRLSVKQLMRSQLDDLEDEKQDLVADALAEHSDVSTTTPMKG